MNIGQISFAGCRSVRGQSRRHPQGEAWVARLQAHLGADYFLVAAVEGPGVVLTVHAHRDSAHKVANVESATTGVVGAGGREVPCDVCKKHKMTARV